MRRELILKVEEPRESAAIKSASAAGEYVAIRRGDEFFKKSITKQIRERAFRARRDAKLVGP